jgi:hypothetical protein
VAAIRALVVLRFVRDTVPEPICQLIVTDEALAVHDVEELDIGLGYPLPTGVLLVAIPLPAHVLLFLRATGLLLAGAAGPVRAGGCAFVMLPQAATAASTEAATARMAIFIAVLR